MPGLLSPHYYVTNTYSRIHTLLYPHINLTYSHIHTVIYPHINLTYSHIHTLIYPQMNLSVSSTHDTFEKAQLIPEKDWISCDELLACFLPFRD